MRRCTRLSTSWVSRLPSLDGPRSTSSWCDSRVKVRAPVTFDPGSIPTLRFPLLAHSVTRPQQRPNLAAGAKVPLRPPAFRPTALPALPCRLLHIPLQPCPLHLPSPLPLPSLPSLLLAGLLLAGLLHCPPHLLVSQLSVDLPHLLQPLLQLRPEASQHFLVSPDRPADLW